MIEPFNIDRYRRFLKTRWLGADLIYIRELPSTNSYLKNLDNSAFGHGTVLLTDHQTEGRGQYDKGWESEKFKNLTFTIAFKPSSGNRLPLLTLCFALGIVNTLDRMNIEGSEIKWPNDILINGKKIGGLLTESVFLGQKPERVLVGIGVNVNQTKFGESISNEATSLLLLCGKPINREELLCRMLQEMEQLYTRWTQQETELCKDINRRIIGFGEWVTVSMNGAVTHGEYKFLGMNEKAECIMLTKDLEVKTFSYEQIRIFPRG